MPAVLLVLALAAPLSQADPEFIQLDPMRSMTQPFSDAVVIGDLMILSGQVRNRCIRPTRQRWPRC